jgi:hypothetical protein
MTTVALLRATLNQELRRVDGDTVPWTDANCNDVIADALASLWIDEIGKRAAGTVATSESSDVYTIPVALQPGRISRIELEKTQAPASLQGRVTSWTYQSDTTVRIQPLLPTMTGLQLRFLGWIPFQTDGSDLPVILERPVVYKAAALAYGQQLGLLTNSMLQQGLDSSRVVDYPTDVGLSAYWERRYQDAIERMPTYRVSFAPRRSSR